MRTTVRDLRRRRRIDRVFALALSTIVCGAIGAACAELPPIERDVCGNQVIDRELGEECDGFVPSELVTACREVRGPATDDGDPCRFECAAGDVETRCLFVADGSTTFCPVGYALGYDSVCRRPSGRFAAEPFTRTEVANLEGHVEDLDGDGVNDLLLTLGPGLTRILYFQEGGGVVAEEVVPALVAVAGRISDDEAADEAADLLVAQGPAITTYRGAEGPALLPKAYAPFENPIENARLLPYRVGPSAAQALEVPPGFDVPLLVFDGPGNDLLMQPIDVGTFTVAPVMARFDGIADDAIGPPSFVDLSPELDPSGVPVIEPEPEIVVATSARIYIGSLTQPAVADLPTPPGETIDALFLVTGGPTPGLAALVTSASGRALRLVLPATLDDPPLPIRFDGAVELPAAFEGSAMQPDLLAVGYINDDPNLDLVVDGGVLFHLPFEQEDGSHYGPPFTTGTEPWAKAVIGDIHADGRNEVVAVPTSGDVVVLLPGTAFTMNPALLPVTTPSDILETGDFDGDGVGDILLVTESEALDAGAEDGCNAADDVYVLFGRTAGLPEDPLLIGSLPGVRSAAPLRLYIDGLADGISDVGMQTGCSPKGEEAQHVGVFLGSTSRIVSSPFSPYATSFDLEPTIERLALGDLSGADAAAPLDAHLDLAVVATLKGGLGFKREVRVVAITGDAEMTDLGESIEIATAERELDLLDHVPGVAVGPLFAGSPSDEVVVFSTARTPGGLSSALHVIERTGSTPKVVTLPLPTPGEAPTSGARVRLFDFDGDGDLDVFAIATNNAEGFLFVNEGATLKEAPFVNPPISYDVGPLAPGSCFAGEAACEASATFVLSDVGLVRACQPGDAAACPPSIDAGQLVTGLVVGDLDADGLEDVAAIQTSRTDFFAQCSQSDVAKGACGGGPVAGE